LLTKIIITKNMYLEKSIFQINVEIYFQFIWQFEWLYLLPTMFSLKNNSLVFHLLELYHNVPRCPWQDANQKRREKSPSPTNIDVVIFDELREVVWVAFKYAMHIDFINFISFIRSKIYKCINFILFVTCSNIVS
jgi:hypothetical protein